MTREELERASDLLESAADSTEKADAKDRIDYLAGQLEELSEADRGPDHGRLARIENALSELQDSTSGGTVQAIEEAHDHVREYRSGVEGV